MSAPRILVIGNSHTQALLRAESPPAGIEVHWLKAKPGARFGTLDPDAALQKVAALGAGDLLVLMHLGTLHNIYGLVNHDHPFTCITALSDPAAAGAELVPVNALRAFFAGQMQADRTVARLVAAAPCRVAHCMPPPPKEVLRPPGDPDKLYHGRSIAEAGFAPAALRLALWEIEQQSLGEHLGAAGVRHLLPPPHTRTPPGFLAPPFHAGDATHANGSYGDQVLAQLAAHAGSGDAGAGDVGADGAGAAPAKAGRTGTADQRGAGRTATGAA